MTVSDAPRTELGHPGGIAPTFGGPGGFYVDGLDTNVDLRFPASTVVYDRMRREDGQVGSVMRAITLPILGTGWRLVGSQVRPEVMRLVEDELGLNLDTGQARRRRQGIVWREHLREALLMLPFGFMPFEVVYDVAPGSPAFVDEFPETKGRLFAHLRKLAPRMPRTLTEVLVARDGGLAGIRQEPAYGINADPRGVVIPVDRLVMYVNDREGADWTGSSVLRAAFKHWLIKDALIRLGAQIVERNGMGIPFVNYTDPGDKAEALRLAKALRAGAESGGALGPGMSVTIAGVSGSTADELPRVKYHDEAIGRSLLAMFLNLGHDNGARALGSTFVDYFLLAVSAVITTIEDVATEHIIRDLVELNYGPDEPYPSLKFDDLSSESTPTAEALKSLADAGLITPDRDLEADVRRRYGLPVKPEATGDAAVEDAAGSPVAEVGIPALIDAGIITPDEGRQMLKLPGQAPGLPAQPAAGVVLGPEDTVTIPAAMAADLAGNRDGIRASLITTGDLLIDDEVTAELTVDDDPLVAQLAALVEKVTALRAGHR